MSQSAFSFFTPNPAKPPKAHVPEDFVSDKWAPPDGPPEFRAVYAMVHFVSYTNLTTWQVNVLWPWLTSIRDEMRDVTDPGRLKFMLGYVVGALEVEQLRNRADAERICERYGVVY